MNAAIPVQRSATEEISGLIERVTFQVREVDIIGNRVVLSEQIKSVLQVQLGAFLDMANVQETVDAIRRLYAANGYGKASVIPSIRRQGPVEVCVAFEVVEGPRSLSPSLAFINSCTQGVSTF